MNTEFFRKYIDMFEAIVDTPKKQLSDIFTEEGKLYPEVKNTVLMGVKNIQKAFPEVKMLDFYMVGGTVTYQYKDTSDIDVSLVYPPDIDQDTFKRIWTYTRELEKKIKPWMGKRPFQFTPETSGGRTVLKNADSAYDPRTDEWIKKPDHVRTQQEYGKLIGSQDSYERKIYAAAERSVQPNLVRLYKELTANGLTDIAKQYITKALATYESIKSWRKRAYNESDERISKNWNTGNIIYKFFDAEHYGAVFDDLKTIKKSNYKVDNNYLSRLLDNLKKVVNDEIGYVPEDRNSFRKYIDIVNEQSVDINQVASQLEFLPTKKQAKQYEFVNNGKPGSMPAMTYTVSDKEQPVITYTSDGKETQNVAAQGDIIMSGPSKENYVVKAAKFPKLYQGELGQTVVPEQSPRMVAVYTGKEPISFVAPWGESMVLKPSDYLVKDGDQGYYRIAKVEYEQTYNQPGK